MKHILRALCVLTLALCAAPPRSEAKVDPLRALSEQLLRAEILVGVDTSGSMNIGLLPASITPPATESGWSGNDTVGTDCGGDRTGTVDLCGDGMCTGTERTGANCTPGSDPTSACVVTTCAADCSLYSNADPAGSGGNTTACHRSITYRTPAQAILPSRAFMVKRALRSALPALRNVASLGLMAFNQTGYYQYYPAAGTTKWVSIFLTEWEMRNLGLWVSNTPMTSCDAQSEACGWRSTPTWYSSPLYLLSHATVQAAGTGITINKDSLYRRSDDPTVENRYVFAGKEFVDGGGVKWEYIGSYYAYQQFGVNAASPRALLSPYRGPQFVEGGTTYVYRRYHYGAYAGTSQQGIAGPSCPGSCLAEVLEPMPSSSLQADHDAMLGKIFAQLNVAPNGGLLFAGSTPTGEMIENTDASADDALKLFTERANGTGRYAGQADTSASCRKRYVLILTDGGYRGIDPIAAAKRLYAAYPSNPIKTIVVGLPGLDASSSAVLDDVADAGDDGNETNLSATAYTAANEAALVTVLKAIFSKIAQGDYATAALGSVTSADQSTVANNVAIQASTEYPGWRGRLRAVDFAKNCATTADCTALVPGSTCGSNGYCIVWEAGAKLDTKIGAGSPRFIYSGKRGVCSNAAIRAWNDSGEVCWGTTQTLRGADLVYGTGDDTTGGLPAGCTPGCGLSLVWPGATANTADTPKQAVVAWLRTQPLGPILNAVPATVGPPPAYGISDHDTTIGTDRAQRDTLIYVPSNNGVLHAFRAATGDEAFGYIPAAALPKIAQLKGQNGQDSDLTKFLWILASSPRVEDLRVDVSASEKWRTEMVVTMGLGGEDFSVIDISNPGDCTGGPPCTLALNTTTGPFKIVADTLSTTHASYTGMTMSLPALYWGSTFDPLGSIGSGYPGTAPDNEYHSQFTNLKSGGDASWAATSEFFAYGLTNNAPTAPPPAFGTLSLQSTAANYGVIAGAVAAIKNGDGEDMDVLATYQAYLNGVILRMNEGKCKNGSDRKVILNAGATHPFHLAPAALYRGGTKVTLAAVSGYYREDDPWMKDPSFTSTMFLRTESSGTVDSTNDNVTVAVNAVCTASGTYGIASGACPDGAPAANALPVDRPILIDNTATGKVEAFFLYYVPPAVAACGSAGTSWLIRIATAGSTQELIKAQKLASGIEAAGMSLVGGGKDIAISSSTRGTGAALPAKRDSSNPLGGGALAGTPRIEVWREVR